MDDAVPIDKIKRLLALAGSPNEHEAKSAMAKAQAYIVRYHLTMEQVQQLEDPIAGYERHVVCREGKNAPLHARYVGGLVTKYFFAKMIMQNIPAGRDRGYVIHVVGKPPHTDIAAHVYMYLKATFKQLWTSYRKALGLRVRDRGVEAMQTSYYQGLVLGFQEKMDAERNRVAREVQRERDAERHEKGLALEAGHGDNSVALALLPDPMLDEATKALMKREDIPIAKPIVQRKVNDSAMRQGYLAGRRIEVNQAIGDGSEQTAKPIPTDYKTCPDCNDPFIPDEKHLERCQPCSAKAQFVSPMFGGQEQGVVSPFAAFGDGADLSSFFRRSGLGGLF